MEFRLLYSGKLAGSNKTDTRAEMKHAIRREFHPQLRRLWNTKRSLGQLARYRYFPHWLDANQREGMPRLNGTEVQQFTDEETLELGLHWFSRQWQCGEYHFVPLVTKELCLRCKIDILFLRPEESNYIMQGGDLDARLKTLFDALRIPTLQEAGAVGPTDDETPFFCLLEDDKLISEVAVRTDQLLVLPKERNLKPSDAFLVIHVSLNPTSPATFDVYF